uniref:Serpin domain-containing protein n=1 Tax=Panagrolaimus sp. ES5 TaxID=591445 RepID=A0AC34GXG2_9BILA
MIANGLYFCGEWETPFQHYYDCLWLSHESVHLRRKERMMARTNHEEEWNFTEGATWKCLGIPFKGRKMWLHIILPKKAMGLAAVLEDFNADILKNCIFKKPSGDINVAIPIFHMENKFSLIETLTKLGINNIFEDIPLSTVINNKSEKLDNICHGSSIDINQFNIPKRVSSNSISNDNESPVERGFGAFQPFIYFVTLVENNVNELKTLLLMGTFY